MKGLARFDGNTFTRFDDRTTPGLGSGPIVFLFEESREDLRVRTRSSEVVLIRAGQAIRPSIGRGSRDGYLVSATETPDGTVWLYTADGQLCRYLDGRLDLWRLGDSRQIGQLPEIGIVIVEFASLPTFIPLLITPARRAQAATTSNGSQLEASG